MRKVKLFIIAILSLLLIPSFVSAAGNITVSTTNLNITNGGSGSFRISASNAAGKVNVSSSNTSVATASISSVFLDNESTTVKVSAKSVGSAVITVYVEDATTYDDENLTGRSYKINVNVKEPVVYSSNNKLKDIYVEGYDLTKIDGNNYELIVNNEVSSIKIGASAEDEKARVSGTGEVALQIGVNNLQVIVTAENGVQNIINLKVTRKDGYYLEDLSTVINKDEEVVILLTDSSKITTEHLETIKKSKKTVTFNYVNENKVVIYSWIVDGNELSKAKEINTKITFTSENVNDIGAASNYAEGKLVNFEHNGELPDSTKVKLYVADKFANGDVINVYSYDKDGKQLIEVKKELEVKDGYIDFDIENASEYFLTRSNVNGVVEGNNGINIFLIISIVELIVIIVLVVMLIMKGKKVDGTVKSEAVVAEVQPVVETPVSTTPAPVAVTPTVASTPTPVVSTEQNVTLTENTIDNNSQNL